jgi:hypothetical protein
MQLASTFVSLLMHRTLFGSSELTSKTSILNITVQLVKTIEHSYLFSDIESESVTLNAYAVTIE